MANPTGKGGFGDHKEHIWRKGTPENFAEFRSLAQTIGNEVAKKGGDDIVIENHRVTVAEMILRSWSHSKDPRLQMAFIEYAYGKPENKTEITGKDGGAIVINWDDDGNQD